MGARAKAWYLLTHAEASLSHGGQGESLVPAHTRGSVSPSRGPGRKLGASSYTRKRLSLTGARAKAWCPPIHAEASLSLTGGRAKAWCLLIHADASLSYSPASVAVVAFYAVGPRTYQAGGTLRTSTRTDIGRACMTYLQGECSHRVSGAIS